MVRGAVRYAVWGVLGALFFGSAFYVRAQRSHEAARVIGVVPKGTTHEFWRSVHLGAEAAARGRDVEILWKGPTRESDYAAQITVVEDLIHRGVSALLLAPTNAESLVPAIERAKAAGIPVVIFDSAAATEDYVSFVATDNYRGGVAGARELARLLGGHGTIAMIKVQPGSASTEERERGFRDTIQREFPGVHIVAEKYGMALRELSLAAATDILTAHPDLAGLFGSNETATHGAMLAVQGRGLAGHVKVVGFDASTDQIAALERGLVHALVVQDPFRMGHDGVLAALDALDGRAPPRRIDTGVTLVTRANLHTPAVQRLLDPTGR